MLTARLLAFAEDADRLGNDAFSRMFLFPCWSPAPEMHEALDLINAIRLRRDACTKFSGLPSAVLEHTLQSKRLRKSTDSRYVKRHP